MGLITFNDIHAAGLLWKRDRPVVDPYLTTHNIHKRQAFMTLAGFEPAIPASEPLRDPCAATESALVQFTKYY